MSAYEYFQIRVKQRFILKCLSYIIISELLILSYLLGYISN